MKDNKLKVMVLTQQDGFFIPTNIIKASEVCNIVEVIDNRAKSSLDNKISDFVKWFGFFQCAKMGMRTYWRKFQDILDRISGYSLFGGKCSISSAAKKIGAKFSVVINFLIIFIPNKVRIIHFI